MRCVGRGAGCGGWGGVRGGVDGEGAGCGGRVGSVQGVVGGEG